MGDYFGIMEKATPQQDDGQEAEQPLAQEIASTDDGGCQTQLVCQCETCRFWKAGNTCRLRDIRLDCYGKCADFEC